MKINIKNGQFINSFIVVLIYLASIILLPYLTSKFLTITSANSSVLLSLIYFFVATVAILYFTKKNKINSIEKDGIKKSLWMSILYSVLGFVIMIMLQVALSIILKMLSLIFDFETISQNTQQLAEMIKRVPLLAVYGIVFAPILEELVFRKAIFGYFYDILTGTKEIFRFIIAGIITGILFAIPHDGFTPLMIVYIVMSLLFSFLYKYTGRIVTPILAHMFMNSLVFIAQLSV